MSFLLNKSVHNLSAADLLFNENLYSPSIHCSYYSCIQFIIYLFYTKFGFSEETLDEKINLLKKGSHSFYINKINDKLYSKNKLDSRNFNRYITKLKKLREDSDYKEKEIYHNNSESAIDLSKKVLNILKKRF